MLLLKRTTIQFSALTSDSSQLPVTSVLGRSKAYVATCIHMYITHIDTYIYVIKTKMTFKNDRHVCYKQLKKSRSWGWGGVYSTCMYVQRLEVSNECFLLLPSTFVLIQGLSVTMEITDWIDWLASRLWWSTCLPLVLGITGRVTTPSYHMGAGDQNSQPHSSAAGTLRLEPPPQPTNY